VAVHGPVLRTADHVIAILEGLPVHESVVQLTRLEIFHDLSLLLVHQAIGEDEVRLVPVGARHGLQSRE